MSVLINLAIGAAVGWIGGGYATYRFMKRREMEKKAILKFSDKPVFHKFENSVRVLLSVEYVKGELSVFNAVSYLTIEIERDGEKSLEIPKEILVKKGEEICRGERWRGYM